MDIHDTQRTLIFWLWLDEGNAKNILMALQQFGFGSLGLTLADLLDPESFLQLGREPNRIDLITSIEGLDFQTCFESKMTVQIDGVDIHFIDLENLIRSKRISGRLQDFADIEKLEKVRRKRKR